MLASAGDMGEMLLWRPATSIQRTIMNFGADGACHAFGHSMHLTQVISMILGLRPWHPPLCCS